VGADLRQQPLGQILRRFSEEHGAKAQPAADRFFQNAESFDGAVTALGALRAGERLAQFFHQSIVPPFDAAKALLGAGCGLYASAHVRSAPRMADRIIRRCLALQPFAVL